MKHGWICLYRSMLDNFLWQEKREFSRAEAWIELLLMVNHEDKTVLVNGKTILVKAGSRITSIASLAESWGWGRKKVSTFLKLLKSEGMLDYESTSKYTLVTILKWGNYQQEKMLEEHQKNITGTTEAHQKNITGTTEAHQRNITGTQTTMINNDNNDKQDIYSHRLRHCAHEEYPQAMSLEVGADESADNHPTHSLDVIRYGDYPTTAEELRKVREFADKLFSTYRRKPACEADVKRVFGYVYKRRELPNGDGIAVFDEKMADLLEYAFDQAVDGGGTSWSYIAGIYQNWERDGVDDTQKAEEREFQRKRESLMKNLWGE